MTQNNKNVYASKCSDSLLRKKAITATTRMNGLFLEVILSQEEYPYPMTSVLLTKEQALDLAKKIIETFN